MLKELNIIMLKYLIFFWLFSLIIFSCGNKSGPEKGDLPIISDFNEKL